jgi:hypothetical protein
VGFALPIPPVTALARVVLVMSAPSGPARRIGYRLWNQTASAVLKLSPSLSRILLT